MVNVEQFLGGKKGKNPRKVKKYVSNNSRKSGKYFWKQKDRTVLWEPASQVTPGIDHLLMAYCFLSSLRYERVCGEQRRLQPPVPVQAGGRAVRLPHRAGADRGPAHLHRARGLPALLPPHRHPPHLPGDQQQQRGHPAHRRQGGVRARLRRHRQPHLLDRHHAEGQRRAERLLSGVYSHESVLRALESIKKP